MKRNNKVVIFPPCGENVALATKRGANKENLFLPLLPRLSAVLPPQGREITARGFTLIELLVVVLIIGILAAVAVPQYRLVVAKSRYAKLKHLVKTVVQAEESYYLANGNYTARMEDLDIDIPNGSLDSESSLTKNKYNYDWGQCILDNGDEKKITCVNSNINMGYREYFTHSPEYTGKRRCDIRGDNVNQTDWRSAICKIETQNNSYTANSAHTMLIWDYQ